MIKMWMSEPGCEPIIIEKVERKAYCFFCSEEMLKHGGILECPRCGNSYKEKMTH